MAATCCVFIRGTLAGRGIGANPGCKDSKGASAAAAESILGWRNQEEHSTNWWHAQGHSMRGSILSTSVAARESS